ncbi:hypothetical protein KY315_02500 [Candidatus Woesearchaeota archaeon]|nr:hypothetical protein [Candidatus Woesearchaeota archaeon]
MPILKRITVELKHETLIRIENAAKKDYRSRNSFFVKAAIDRARKLEGLPEVQDED